VRLSCRSGWTEGICSLETPGRRRLKKLLIVVLLPGCLNLEHMSPFMRRMMWVDFREGLNDSEAFKDLGTGIRGVVPGPDGDSV
jgi:hypothetical protein